MKETTLSYYKERMLRVLVHVQQNLDDELSLDDLARIACFSPYHFHRIFRGMLGESVKEHIRRLRLERAATRLKHGDAPVVQIAFEAGYETHESFTRAFKAMCGLSPVQFRNSNGSYSRQSGPSKVHYQEGGILEDFKPLSEGGEKMEVKIMNLDAMRVAFVRHVGPYNECGSAWEKLCAHLGQQGLLGGDLKFIGLCHDDPEVTPADKIRYDACVTVDESYQPEGEIGVQSIAGGEYAMVTHFGPYDKFNETYAQLCGQWMPRSGREMRSAPCLEIYLNDPESTEPEDLLTDIYAPLVPR